MNALAHNETENNPKYFKSENLNELLTPTTENNRCTVYFEL